MVKEDNTQQKILDAARTVFMKKGLAGARMQEIADEAGINKALLHYYFRTKEKLYYAILEEAFQTILPLVADVFNSSETLEMKLNRLAAKYVDLLEEHRYLPLFVLNELQMNPGRISEFINLKKFVNLSNLKKQVQAEYGLENINEGMLIHAFINFLSNMIFPFIARPIIQFNLGITEELYREFLMARKVLVPRIFIETLKSMNEYAKNIK